MEDVPFEHRIDESTFQQWIDELKREIREFGSAQIDNTERVFSLYKIAQNVLSLAAGIKLGSNGEVFCNLMVHEPSKKMLRVVLTHGFYYEQPFRRVFPLESDKSKSEESSTCAAAFNEQKSNSSTMRVWRLNGYSTYRQPTKTCAPSLIYL